MDTLAAVILRCLSLLWRTNMYGPRGIFLALSAVLSPCIVGVQLARATTQPAFLEKDPGRRLFRDSGEPQTARAYRTQGVKGRVMVRRAVPISRSRTPWRGQKPSMFGVTAGGARGRGVAIKLLHAQLPFCLMMPDFPFANSLQSLGAFADVTRDSSRLRRQAEAQDLRLPPLLEHLPPTHRQTDHHDNRARHHGDTDTSYSRPSAWRMSRSVHRVWVSSSRL